MATDYGGQAAYGAQGWHGGQPGSPVPPSSPIPPGSPVPPGSSVHTGHAGSPGPGERGRHGRAGRAVAVVLLLLGVTGLGVSLVEVATQVLPRQFTAHQQRQILDWEAGKLWRTQPAGGIFPGSVYYSAPPEIGGTALRLTATRIGIARQASCTAATDAAVAHVLERNGCQAVLRATYADATNSYVVTVGVAVFPGLAEASDALGELPGPAAAGASGAPGVAPGIQTVRFRGTPAAWFTNDRRWISASAGAGTYVVFYTAGYADKRSRVLNASDDYADSEMTSLGAGVAQAVAKMLTPPVPQPHCPGTPGC